MWLKQNKNSIGVYTMAKKNISSFNFTLESVEVTQPIYEPDENYKALEKGAY